VPANLLDFFSCGCMSLGICLKAFVIITVFAAPVSAVAGPAYGPPYGDFALN
jgi:hypothetical protein